MMVVLDLFFGSLGILAVILAARWDDSRTWRASLTCYRLMLPPNLAISDVTNWLTHTVATTHATGLAAIHLPQALGLEVSSDEYGITHTLIVPRAITGAVMAGLRATLPAVRIEEVPPSTAPVYTMAAEARLTNLFKPLAHERAELASASILAALQPLYPGERITLQWLLAGAPTPAPVHAGAATSNEAAREARAKQAEPMLQAVVRLGAAARDEARATSLFGRTWGTLRSLNTPGARLVRRRLPSALVAARLSGRRLPLTRFPLILNAKELAGLLGFPLSNAHLPGLPRITSRQLPPAIHMPHAGTVLGLSNYPGMANRPLALATSDRLRHTWVLGPTGTGKSTLLANLIIQDMKAGRAVLAVDPKGDLITDILNRVPESRADDVVLIDPSRTDYPVSLNVLDVGHDEDARELAVDQLVHLMASLWHSSFGPRTADVLRMGMLTLISARTKGGLSFTLIELPELLLNASFRRMVTAQASVPATVRSFWMAYEAMSPAERAQVIGPSLNKLRSFTTRTSLRLLLGQSRGIRLNDIFTRRRIVLVSLAPGRLGADTAALFGSLVVSSFWAATLQRVAVPEDQRHPVSIYLDEFQTFLRLPLDLADMLAQARGLGVGLTLSHQYLGQLSEATKTAVLGTVRTQLVFQLQPEDARTMSARFLPLMGDDLVGLGAYEVAIRPCVEGATLTPVTGRTLPLPPPTTDGAALALASLSRFGYPRAEVEAALNERLKGRSGNSGVGRDWAEDDPA